MKNCRFFVVLIIITVILYCFSGCSDSGSVPTIAIPQGTVAGENESSASGAESANEQEMQSTAGTAQTNKNAVAASWFDDAVFVGDSVTLKLSYYCDSNPEALSKAQFFCAGSLGYTSALWELDHEDAVHPYYEGENYRAQDCAAVTGAKKVFVMLGMNDIGLYGIDESVKSAQTLMDNIKSVSPDVSIYVQSVTPILAGMEKDDLNNELIREFNGRMQQLCAENNYPFLDVYSQVADEEGCLKAEYCSDPEAQGIHFSDEACALWTQYLKENVS